MPVIVLGDVPIIGGWLTDLGVGDVTSGRPPPTRGSSTRTATG